MCTEYRKAPNVLPGLMEVRKHFVAGLYSGGFIFGGLFEFSGDLCMPKTSPFGVKSEKLTATFNA